MALPFGLGAAVSVGLYKLQNDNDIPFSSFLLFLGVAMAITAFPVLARILAELKLLRTRVGVITMSAGLLNDCVAWVLLALVVALLNSSGGLEALYVFLTTVAFALFLIIFIAPLYRRLAIKTGSFERGPSPFLMAITLLLVLVSAFVTDIIGVHPIFGGFLAGVIVPHDHDLAIKITEKIEDIVNIIFLPLYFTLSGLKTQIGLLNTGTVWGYVILVIFLACFGKIAGCAIAARLTGLTTRESWTIGFLMSCKGLVELIVLNIGHDAGVLNDQIFVIMVVMALITTFMTTPIVMWLYPEWYQKQTAERFANGAEHDTEVIGLDQKDPSVLVASRLGSDQYFSLVTMLNRINTVPSVMALIRLLKQDPLSATENYNKSRIDIHALRLLELTQRASDIMKIQDIHETQKQDPVLNVLRTFASLVGIESIQTRLDFCTPSEYINAVADYSESVSADMILLPWVSNSNHAHSQQLQQHQEVNPFDVVDWKPYQISDVDFASSAYSITHSTVGLFIDRGFGHIQDGNPELHKDFQIIVPFTHGGADDRAALIFALRLHSRAKILVLKLTSDEPSTTYATQDSIRSTLNTANAQNISDDALLEGLFTSSSVVSSVMLWSVRYPPGSNMSEYATLLDTLETPLDKHDLVVLGRSISASNASNLPTASPTPLEGNLSTSPYSRGFKSALGNTAFQILSAGTLASLVVVQAPTTSEHLHRHADV
ncbi:Sodium/hydrogen exchanger family-domain-containing protein [Parasitella parasitica]|nr:Sodium/hydrogen exchanger family-domain-containing protein [Parasitella parasitica]